MRITSIFRKFRKTRKQFVSGGNSAVREAGGMVKDMALDVGDQIKHARRNFLAPGIVLRVFNILAVIGITVTILVFRDQLAGFEAYGYLGAFVINLVSSATVLFPVPGIAVLFVLGATHNPLLLALAAAAGSTLGEATGYIVGYSGQALFKQSGTYLRLERWMKRNGLVAIGVLAFLPNPAFDVAGAAAGVLRMPYWKFFLACFAGKAPKMALIAFGGYLGLPWVSNIVDRIF